MVCPHGFLDPADCPICSGGEAPSLTQQLMEALTEIFTNFSFTFGQVLGEMITIPFIGLNQM
jgi:hypothetical protein